MPVIWVALAIIMAAGVTISVLSHYSYLPLHVGYAGIAIAGTSLSALAISYLYRPSSLKQAMKAAKTFTEMRALFEQPGIRTNLSFFGTCDISVAGRMGSIALTSVAKKMEKMVGERKFFYTEEERVAGEALVKILTPLFEKTDEEMKTKNLLTQFFYGFPGMFIPIVYTATIYARWFEPINGAGWWFHINPTERPKELLGWSA